MASTLIAELHKKSNSLENLAVSGSIGTHARPQSIACDPSVSRPHLITSDDYGGSSESGVNLVGYRQINANNLVNSNTRWHSDTNLASNPYHSHSQLSVNKGEVDINDENDSITIYWDIKESVSAKDWIGLYRTDQAHPGKWLDYRNRGVSGSKKGELVWHFNRLASIFTEPETRVCFRYYYGNTGDLRAVTEPILVRNALATAKTVGSITRRLSSVDGEAEIVHLAIQDIEATHVRKGMFFNPDPYVKIRVEPGPDRSQPVLSHHYKDSRTSVCENTTEPRWPAEVFHFMALPSDNLFMKVKDRFTSARPTLLRFLGQVSVPIKQVMDRARLGLTVTCQLMGRNPHDHVCGTIVFRPTIIPHDTGRTLNGENGQLCCGVTDSTVESILDRSSASILSTSDEDEDAPSAAPTSVRELTHTYSGTSGDSSVDAGMSIGGTIEHETSSSSTVQVVVEDSSVFSSDSTQEEHSTDEDGLGPPRCDSDVLFSVTDTSVDPLTVYQEEARASNRTFGADAVSRLADAADTADVSAEADVVQEVEQTVSTENEVEVGGGEEAATGGMDASGGQDASGRQAASGGEISWGEEDASGGETVNGGEYTSGVDEAVVQGTARDEEHVNDGEAPSSGEQLTVGQKEAMPATAAELESQEVEETGESHDQDVLELTAADENEKRHSLPPPDFPPPSLPANVQIPTDDANNSLATSNDATPVFNIPSIAECALLKVGGDKSSSVWSLENHTGSRENICEAEPSAGPQDVSQDLSNYQNMSNLMQRSNPPTPEPDGSVKEKRPLPQPRDKTLAEQLNNLQVIESEASTFHRQTRPPSLPQKTKVASVKVTSGQSKRKTLASEDSLEMPAGIAPLPPSGAKPKKLPSHQQEVAAQYGVLDATDARPKRTAKTDEPPVLQPRKKASDEVPPRLPPRSRQKADGSIINTGQQDVLLDEVFEPTHPHRHHKHHKPKVRNTESEEARVAAEVANAAASLPRSHNMKSESIEVEEALPAGWEARVDAHGRVFYIDHNNKSTTWERPSGNSVKSPTSHRGLQRVPSISNSDRMNMDNRYRIIKRMSSVDTISERNLSPPRHHAPAPPSLPASVPQANHDSHNLAPATTPRPQSTLPQANVSASNISSSQQTAPASAQGAASTSSSAGQPKTTPPDAETRQLQEVIRNSPAVKFLKRTDFFSLVQYSDEAQVAYTSNSALKHMVHKIRKDPMTFQKYWHNKDLVNFLNMFVNKDEELPGNWQMKHDKTGKVFFLDHSTKTTTFIDPRLPTTQPALNPGQQMPLPRNKYRPADGSTETAEGVSNLPTAYDEKVVIFLRQPNVMQVLQERYHMLKKNESLKNKINTIISDGTPALKKYRNHVELTILLSMFENEVMSYVPLHLRAHQEAHTSPKGSPAPAKRLPSAPLYKRDFQEKYRTFLRKLEGKGIGQGPNKIKMRVQRNHLLEDSFKKIMSYSKKDLQKNKLLISFLGEEGLDYGGPAREFFFLLSRELFNPYYGLFEYSANDTYTVQISPMSTFVDNAAEWFRFAGRMIGLCIVHQYLMDSFFTRPFYKMLLRETCVLSDLESLDAEFHQSLLWIKDNDISEAGLDLTFSVDEEVFGQVTERELKPNGMNIPVTNRNKKEYIEKMVTWRIDRGVNEQKEHLMKGFYEVIEPKLISVFDAKDLELVIAGTAEIDIVDWRNNTEYRSGYYDTHPIVDWFWQVMQSFDNEKRLRLLQFVTGTSSIPFEGFSALRGSNGPRKFTIEKWGTAESLPRAHTCFNRLDLPMYTSKETMQEKLLLAISETSTFGIE